MKFSIKQITIALLIVFLTGGLVSGCDRSRDDEGAKLKKSSKKQKSETDSKTAETVETDKQETKTQEANEIALTLYFANDQGDKLVREVRRVAETQAVATAAINELIAGPQSAGHFSALPRGTRLLNIRVENGVAIADFSAELINNHPGGSSGELMTVYSIVNTLTEFSTVTKVRFLVTGGRIDTIAGHMDLSVDLERREDLVASQQSP